MATDVQLLENRLAEYEHKARAVCIGVNQLALGTERIQQDDLLRQVKHLEEELKRLNQQKTGLHKRALDVRNDVKGNAAALRYLETISQLERSFTVLTENVTETSVQLSSPKALPESVHVKKDLGDNVQSCWNYVTQLSRLTQVHIHNAAEYQQFHHALSKVEANLNKRLRMTHPDHMRQLPEELSSAPMIANELRDHLNHFIHLWTETGHLIEESRRIVPVHLRLGGVKNGVSINTESSSPVMARALLPLAGPNYELDEGEAVRIINNSDDPHSWKVHTSSGIAEIPSVSLWISDPDVEAMKRAIVVRERCVETWEVVVERMRERLRVYYTHLLSQMAERGTIYYSSKNVMQHLLADLDNFDPSTDVAGLELRRSLNLFQEQLQLIPRGSQPPSGITLREQDIVSMHSPLLRFRDHEHQMANLGVQSQFLGKHLTSYLQQIDSERRRVDEELAVMGSLQRDQQAQLDHLIGRVRRWSSRYDGRAPLEFSIHDSMGSSSIHSSTHSDQRLEAKTGFTDHTARIDAEHVRPTSSQQKSLIDVITQIGVDTTSAVCQTDLSLLSQSMVDPGPQTISEFRAIHVEESTRGTTIGSGISVGPVLQRLPLVASSPPKKEVFDAICQIGLVQGTTHTQTDRGMGLHSTVFQTDSVSLPSRTTADTICQVGSISRSTAVQAVESFISPQLPVLARSGFDVGCQAELIAQPHTKVPLRVQVARPLQALPSRSKQNAATTQADLIPPRMPTVNVLVQTGILTNWKTTQTDSGIEPEFVARSFTSRQQATPISGYADYAMWTGSQGSSMSHTACQIGVVRTEKQCQTEMAESTRTRARSVDVRSQTAMSPPASRAKSHDVLTQVGIVQESRGLQFEAPVPAAMSLPIRASTSDVQMQIGVVRKGQETQTEKEERLDRRMVDKPLERFDVEVQNGVRGISDWCQTEEMVLPMKKHYDVQLQSGIRNTSQGLQTDIEVVTVLKRFDVETQSGVRDKPEWCQTDMAVGKKADVYDVAVDANLRPKLKDYSFETESLPELELVAPVQLARPPEPQNDKGVQASSLTTSCDVELQSGIRANSMSVQTDMGAPIVAPKKYNAEIQSGIRNKTDWTQTDMASVSTSSAMTHTPPSPKPNDYACETDAPLEVTRVEQVRMAPTWTSKEEMGVQAEYVSTRYDVQLQSGIRTRADETQTDDFLDVQVYAPVRSVRPATTTSEKDVQAVVVQERYDVEAQSGILDKSRSIQTDAVMADIVPMMTVKRFDVEVQSGILDDSHGVQTEIQMKASMPKRYDVETQSGIREKPEWCQTELELRKASKVFDTEVDATMWPDMRDYVLETESVPEVELVAPMQHARPPIKVDDKGMQTFIRSTTYDVEVQSGLIEYSRGMQTDLASMVLSAKKYDVAVQLGICSRAELCQTDMEFKTKAQVCDAEVDASMLHVRSDYVLETESPPELELVAPMQHAQPATQTDDKGVQAFTRSVLYDVEVQSGLVDYTQGVQTEAQSAAVALRKFDVELQSGIRDKSEWCQTDVGYRPVVETQDAEVDAALDTASRDYTLETDALLEVQVAQPVLASRAYIDKEDIGLQAAMVPARFDVELQSGVTTAEGKTQVDELLKPEVSVSNRSVQTAVESVSPVFNKKLQVCLSPIPVDAILQSDDAVMKDLSATVQREPLKKVDIGLQTVVSDRTECCQVDLGLRTKVEVMDVGVDASMRHVRSDYLFETESLPAVELVAPIQHAGPPTQTDDKSMQAFIRAATFDVIAQSGLVSTSRGAQTDAAPMAVLAKKFDVETQAGICSKAELCQTDMELRAMKDYVLETDSLPEVELVAPIEHAPPPIQVDDKCIQAVGGVVCYDAELQSGVTTSIGVTQVDEFLKPKVSVSGRSVQTDDQLPLSVLNKKLQVRLNPIPFDVTVQSDDVPMMDFSALVQQAALKKFDVEAQAGLMYTSECSQTDMVFKSKVDVLDAEVDACMRPAMGDYVLETDSLPEIELVAPVQLARPPAQLDDKSVQVSSRAVVYDVELQAGVTTSNSVTQVDDDLLRLQVPISGRSVQTDVESAVLPVVNKKLQVCINPIPVDSTFDAIEDFRSGYGAGLSRVPRIDVGLQCAISPRLFDVELQSGSTQSTVASQTEADRYVSSAVAFGVEPVSSFAIPVDCVLTTDAPPDPIVIPSIQSSTSRPALSAVNKKLQVSLDHHLQVSSINQASQCEEVAKHPVINSNIQVNLRSERSEASTQFVDMLEKAQAPVQSAKISTSTSVAVQCDRRQSYRDASTHSELFAISKGELQHMEAKPIVEMTTKASHYYGDTTRIPVPTQVTTVSYQSMQPIPSHSSQRLVDAYCEVMYPTSVIQVDTQSQALSQPRESTIITLDKTATSYVQPHSAEFISAAPISSAPKAPILVDSNFGFTHAQKNKKCQINLLDGSSARSQMLNKKLQTQVRQEDASCECMLVDSRSSPITPAGQTEAQVQATPYSLNKKLQVKIQPTTTVSATLTECASVEVRLQPIGSRVSTRDAGVMSEPLGAQQVWTQCAEVFEPKSVPLIKAEAGHVEEVLDMPIARSEASAETLAALEPVVSRGRVHAMLEKTPTQTVTQLVTKGSSFQSERLETAHKMFSPLYTQTQLQLEVPRSDEWSQTVGAEPELESIRRSPVPQTRHVRIQKGSSWLVSRQQDVEVQASPLTSTEVEIRLTDLIQGAPRIDVPDSGEAGVTKPHGSRPSSTTSPTGSIRGLRYPRQEAVNWGVQCTPLTLNGVTQTSDLTRTESGSDISDHSTTAVRRPKHYGGTSVGLQTSFDDEYTIKRVVTTIARRGNVSVHKRSTPVVRYMHARGRPSLLTTSLPSHLDEQLLAGAEDDESEDGYETPTTAKVTTFSVDGERRVVRDDLHFGPRGRGRSLDSRLGPHSHLGGSDIYESDLADMHDEIHMQSQAEMYFDRLLRTWGAPYLLSRLSRRGSAMSVDRDVNGTDGSRLARLIGVKTQYTSTGNLAAYYQGGGNTRTTETQTAGLLPQGRPPHRNKRIQRGQSYISWTPGQAPVPVAEISPTVGESPLGYTQQHATPSFGFSSTYTETIRERVATCGRMDDYVCPNCGYHAHLPQYRPGSMSTVQPLPITQLRNVTCQTAEMGVDAIDPIGQTLPIYITDEDLMHINPRQHFSEDRLLSKVTWCEAGGSLKVGDSSSSSHLVDEVWIDSPGKLLEVHTTGVVIPGSDRVISAAEAFYRGILRVIYWDYTKAAPSSMLLAESGIVTPIADAVVADLVRLACYSPERVMMGKTDRSALSINTHVVWTTPEKHRTRYAVHAVRPEGERQGASYSVASAFAAGYIRKDDGQLALRHSMYADVGYETGVQSLYSDTVEKISVQEAIVRGILDVELIATDSPSVRAQMAAYEKTPYRSDYSSHDVDV